MKFQAGGFVLGLVVGLLVGLSLALGVALYITKAPVPFVNKVPQRTAEQDQAEIERNRKWDPNAPLAPKAAAARASAAAASVAAASAASGAAAAASGAAPAASGRALAAASAASGAAAKPSRDPAAILSGAAVPGAPAASTARVVDSFMYFVQAGAYTRAEEAEQQRAKLAMIGMTAKITEREQQGRTVYRVRLGPFETRNEADSLLGKVQENGIEGQLVRVERP